MMSPMAAAWAFYSADNGEQNLANGIVVANAANAQDAASNAVGRRRPRS